MDRKPVSVKSYANIAIIKYWGKENSEAMVPSTSSISLTLENMYTETRLSPLGPEAKSHAFFIDGVFQNGVHLGGRVVLEEGEDDRGAFLTVTEYAQ